MIIMASKEKNAARMRKDYWKNPAKYKTRNKEQYVKFRSERISKVIQHRRDFRQNLLKIMGGKCVRCGEVDWRCLQIDHVNGGGSARKDRGRRRNYLKYYGNILREFLAGSKEYQILCANCNFKKRYENGENC